MTMPPGETPEPDMPDEDVASLRAEVSDLRTRLDSRQRRQVRRRRFRSVVAAVLVVLAMLGVVGSVIGVWAARTTLNTDKWVSAVGPLPQDPAVNAAVSQYLTTQIITSLDVQQRVSEALPPRAAFLATPLTGQVRTYVQKAVRDVLATPQFEQIWTQVNRAAHASAVAVIENKNGVVRRAGNKITLDLLPVVNQVLALLEQRVPTIFGRDVNIPPITDGKVPADLRTKVQTSLGVTLPPDFAQVTLYKANELGTVQDAIAKSKQFLVALVLGSLVATALALWVSPRRRRTVLQLGVWLAVWVLVVSAVVRGVRNQLLGEVPAGTYRDGASSALHVFFTGLRTRADQALWLGIVVALVAYLVGPGRLAVRTRAGLSRGGHAGMAQLRRANGAARADGPGLVHRYLDPLRVGGLVVAGLVALLLSSWTSLFVVLVVLAAYELVVTLAAAPAAGSGAEPAAWVDGVEGGTGTDLVPEARAGEPDAGHQQDVRR